MKLYLLDTGVLVAYFKGRAGAVHLIQPWIVAREAATSQLVYGEAIEYLKRDAAFERRRAELRLLLREVTPLNLSYAVMERYADLRRALRPPYGPGLIGDVDTLVAATALVHHLTLVTTDSDHLRVRDLTVMHLQRSALL